jgi:hypothetical protein
MYEGLQWLQSVWGLNLELGRHQIRKKKKGFHLAETVDVNTTTDCLVAEDSGHAIE